MNKSKQKLEAMLAYVYGHFLDEGETLPEFMASRRQPLPNIRHIVRRKVYRHLECTYKQIGVAEGQIGGRAPINPSTICHSVSVPVERFCEYERADRQIAKLIGAFEDAVLLMDEPHTDKRLRHYYEMPHHVLAVVACLAEKCGYVDDRDMDRLHEEFKTVGKGFVARQIY